MTYGQRVQLEELEVTDLGNVALAPKTTIKGANFPFAGRVFGRSRPQFAYYSFVAGDWTASSIALEIYWTTPAADVGGTVGWIAAAAKLNTSVTTPVNTKEFAADNGTFYTNVLGSWRFHKTVYLLNNDSYAAGSLFIVRLSRDVTDESTAGDAYVLGTSIIYTGV
jgi:hypothetical protein